MGARFQFYSLMFTSLGNLQIGLLERNCFACGRPILCHKRYFSRYTGTPTNNTSFFIFHVVLFVYKLESFSGGRNRKQKAETERQRGERERACLASGTEKFRMARAKSGSSSNRDVASSLGLSNILLPLPGRSWLGRWQTLFLFLECFTVCKMLPCMFFISFHVNYDEWQSWDCKHSWGQRLGDLKWCVQGHTAKGKDSHVGLLIPSLVLTSPPPCLGSRWSARCAAGRHQPAEWCTDLHHSQLAFGSCPGHTCVWLWAHSLHEALPGTRFCGWSFGPWVPPCSPI